MTIFVVPSHETLQGRATHHSPWPAGTSGACAVHRGAVQEQPSVLCFLLCSQRLREETPPRSKHNRLNDHSGKLREPEEPQEPGQPAREGTRTVRATRIGGAGRNSQENHNTDCTKSEFDKYNHFTLRCHRVHLHQFCSPLGFINAQLE